MDNDGELRLTIMATLAREESRKKNNGHTIQRDCVTVFISVILPTLLMKNPRRVYSRESLMDLVWGYSYAGDYRTVDVHIRRLREKLERVPAEPAYIITKWGVGYYFAGEDQPTI